MVAQGYKDTEIGVIPVEWDVVKIKDIGNISTSSIDKKIHPNENLVNMVNYMDVYNNHYKEINSKINFMEVSCNEGQFNSCQIVKGDVLFTPSSETADDIGLSAVVNNVPINTVHSYHLVRLRFTKDLSLHFKKFIFNSSNVLGQFTKSCQGTTRKTLKVSDFQNIAIPLPPLKEQEKIADILSTADEKIDAIASQIQKAQTLKKGLLQKLLSEGIGHSEFKDSELGKIPKSWEVVKLNKLIENKSIISHLDGNHGGLYPKQSEFVENGIPYLSANMIKDNHIDFSLAKFLTKERASKFRKGVAKNKDVLFAHNATVGPVTILRTDLEYVILSTTLTYYRCDLEKLDNYYLMNYMKSIYFINQYEKFMKQSTRNQIPITQQRQLFFIIPPLEEQKQIAEILSTADEKIEVLMSKKQMYETLKKGLLQKLLSGEVRV